MTREIDGPAGPNGWDAPEDEDAALARLEDVLLALPEDRALPDLEMLLSQAKYPPELLRRDDRALKLINEAVLARPFATEQDTAATRSHLELMLLEVEVLTARLRDPGADVESVASARTRLQVIRDELDRIRDQL